MNHNKAFIIVVVLLSASVSGYELYQRYNAEEEPRFQWPDKVDIPCNPDSTEFDCEVYAQVSSTPVKSLQHPTNNEIWIAALNGIIASWDGTTMTEIGNLSNVISNCHNEQGLLGFEFTHDFSSSQEILLSYTENADCEGGSNLSGMVIASVEVFDLSLIHI